MPDGKPAELWQELRGVLSGAGLLDAILPSVVFLVLNNSAGFRPALAGALSASALAFLLRLVRKQKLTYALAGLASVALAAGLGWTAGRADGYFLPALVNDGITLALGLISLALRKPMVAWTSHLARRWPLDWYWHDLVRPAYGEVTWAWMIFFALRLGWQALLLRNAEAGTLALVNLLTLVGYVGLGGLLTIFSNQLGRRGE